MWVMAVTTPGNPSKCRNPLPRRGERMSDGGASGLLGEGWSPVHLSEEEKAENCVISDNNECNTYKVRGTVPSWH